MKHTGIPVPQFAYGYTLQKVTELEKKITADPKEQEVRKTFADRAAAGRAALADQDKAYAEGKAKVEKSSPTLRRANAPADEIAAAEKAVAAYPKDVVAARSIWQREAGLAARSADRVPMPRRSRARMKKRPPCDRRRAPAPAQSPANVFPPRQHRCPVAERRPLREC